MKGKIGRPTLDAAYRIRAQVWFNAVSLASGRNDRELEGYFGQRVRTGVNVGKYCIGANPGLWRKYKLGLSCPKTRPAKGGKQSIVERVEKQFPGTAKWMSMPFWDTLSSKTLEMSELKEIYYSLSPHVRDLIVIAQPQPNDMFWRKQTDIETICRQLINIGDLDAITAILALIKEAETTQNQHTHLYVLECWSRNGSAILQQYPEIAPLLKKINATVEDRFTPAVHERHNAGVTT